MKMSAETARMLQPNDYLHSKVRNSLCRKTTTFLVSGKKLSSTPKTIRKKNQTGFTNTDTSTSTVLVAPIFTQMRFFHTI